MARLPTPGSDEGQWGSILNDFLVQIHNSDGTLKANVVSTTALQDGSVTTPKIADANVTNAKLAADAVSTVKIQNNAVTTPKIADGSVTANKLAPGIMSANAGIRQLLIVYAAPNTINGQFNDDYAAGILARYDDVVLGTGLEDPGNVYHASTVAIISKVAALAPDTVIWGYIDTGVTTGNLSLATLQTQIDQWVAMGAKGIFCDVIGYAYGVSRARQNSIINYIHSKGVGAILNVFNPDEVLSSAVDATYNPSGAPTVANSSDVLLLESWITNSDAYTTPFYATFSDIKTRGDKALSYRASLGIRIFGSNILSHNDHTFSELKAYRDYAEAFARVWRLDGTGVAASNYSATGADVGLVTPQFTSFKSIPLRPTAPYILNGPWTQVQAPDLGIIVNYDVGVHTWTQQ